MLPVDTRRKWGSGSTATLWVGTVDDATHYRRVRASLGLLQTTAVRYAI